MNIKLTGWVKGKVAETLIDRIFDESGYKIRIAAMWKCASLEEMRTRHQPRSGQGDVPDFLIWSGEPEYLEVKYRWDGKPYKGEEALTEQCKKYGFDPATRLNVLIVRNSQPYFSVVRAPYFDPSGAFANPIPIRSAGWDLKEGILLECERLIEEGIFNWR